MPETIPRQRPQILHQIIDRKLDEVLVSLKQLSQVIEETRSELHAAVDTFAALAELAPGNVEPAVCEKDPLYEIVWADLRHPKKSGRNPNPKPVEVKLDTTLEDLVDIIKRKQKMRAEGRKTPVDLLSKEYQPRDLSVLVVLLENRPNFISTAEISRISGYQKGGILGCISNLNQYWFKPDTAWLIVGSKEAGWKIIKRPQS